MIIIYSGEKFKEIEIEKTLQFRYAISDFGRLISFSERFEDGRELKGQITEGYRVFRYKVRIEGKLKTRCFMIYKLVGDYFIPKKTENHVHLIHLDRDKLNDRIENLKWVTKEEYWDFFRKSPSVIQAGKDRSNPNYKTKVRKLSVSKVMFLKKKLNDPEFKTRRKILAKQFGVSEMQLYRIKSGENWTKIKV